MDGTDKKSKVKEGKFKTYTKNQAKVKFVASSCTTLMSESISFDKMSELNPDFFLNVGDMHYSANSFAQPEDFVFAYHEVFKSQK